jgi:hypothetical protein
MHHLDQYVRSNAMANPTTCKPLNDELVQLQADYQALTGFKWFLFKLTSWSLASALDDFDPADVDSVKHLYTVYESSWFPWLGGLFDIYNAIKDLLFHRLLSHFGAEDELNVMSHPKADELLLFSEQFGGIQDQQIMAPLLEHAFVFDFVKHKFTTMAPDLEELKRTIPFKLGQFEVFNALSEKTNQPVERFFDVNDEQVILFAALLQQDFEPDEVSELVDVIRKLAAPQKQRQLLDLYRTRPGIFHAHR